MIVLNSFAKIFMAPWTANEYGRRRLIRRVMIYYSDMEKEGAYLPYLPEFNPLEDET